jgi:IclR family acetate operon transcriptional repressor
LAIRTFRKWALLSDVIFAFSQSEFKKFILQEFFFHILIECMVEKSPSAQARRRAAPLPKGLKNGIALPVPDGGEGLSSLKPFSVLEAIVNANHPMSVTEVSGLLSLPQPTAHRIVRLLVDEGLLEREPGTRRYLPGSRLIKMGFGIVGSAMKAAPRRSILQALSRDIGETCNFGIMAGNSLTYLDRVEAAWPFGLRFEPGSKVPLHCTAMGKLLLSFLPADRRKRLISTLELHLYTNQTIVDPDRLEEEFKRIRETEVSVDNQEFLAGVVCVAVPVRAPNGQVAAGLALSAPLARLPLERALSFAPRLRKAAKHLGETLSEPLNAENGKQSG